MKSRRILSFVLVLLMISALLPLSIFAQLEKAAPSAAETTAEESAKKPTAKAEEDMPSEKCEKTLPEKNTGKRLTASDEDDIFLTGISATVTAPVIGEQVDFTIVIPPDAHYTASVSQWYKGNKSHFDYEDNFEEVDSSYKFEKNYDFKVKVKFLPDPGYCFTRYTESEINGRPDHDESFYNSSDGSFNGILCFKG